MNKERVLIVEDDADIREGIRILLESENYKVIEAENGRKGLELLDENIDLVILDIMMPGIDGYEVCKQLRLKTKKPIIFISALSEEENQLMVFELGADDYVMKPFQPSILYAKVVAMIKRDQKQEEHLLVFWTCST